MSDIAANVQWLHSLPVNQIKAILQKLGSCASDIGDTDPVDALLKLCLVLQDSAAPDIAEQGVLNYVQWMCAGTWFQFDEAQWKLDSILHDNFTVVEHWAFKLLMGKHPLEFLCDLQPFLIDAPFQALGALKTEVLVHQRCPVQFNSQTGFLEFAAGQISRAESAWSQEICIAAAAILAFRSEVGPFNAKAAMHVWSNVCTLFEKSTLPWKNQAGIVVLLLLLLQDRTFYSVVAIAEFIGEPTQGICLQCNELLRAHQKKITTPRTLNWGKYILDKPDEMLKLIDEKKRRKHKQRDSSPQRQ